MGDGSRVSIGIVALSLALGGCGTQPFTTQCGCHEKAKAATSAGSLVDTHGPAIVKALGSAPDAWFHTVEHVSPTKFGPDQYFFSGTRHMTSIAGDERGTTAVHGVFDASTGKVTLNDSTAS